MDGCAIGLATIAVEIGQKLAEVSEVHESITRPAGIVKGGL